MLQQNTLNKGFIKEIFKSYQGEGKFVGARQIFIRFADCPFSCEGCDTDFSLSENFLCDGVEYSNPVLPDELFQILRENYNFKLFHSVSITGGEPLIQKDFLSEFLPILKDNGVKVFLETSGYLVDEIIELSDYLDIISVDIKLKSVFGKKYPSNLIKDLKVINEKIYYKVVIGKNIDENEIKTVLIELAKNDVDVLYVQFKNNYFNLGLLDKLSDIGYSYGIEVFFVPQVHKLIGIL
ncbi:7-carboxy-7-deazaguanine synthase QueE [Deferribacter autotrophicus]|uniref:7-carboxy-7-deazaguanine synthase n=1 Tax=Deferribacter autotrophicus TaxID=500465 RepID=A0A5A8F7S8_9BACT|nr:7-carboxy-7-deazaguanine synthase QueE [Deferribacter autotrophicus]KAA0259173.1 7-carboxy-7-deazaguanine synthase QueE [Deferribacter autotrophicus]